MIKRNNLQNIRHRKLVFTLSVNFKFWKLKFIRLLPINFLEGQIRPEDLLVGDVHIQCNYVFLTGDDLSVLTLIQSHLPHLVPVSEEQIGYSS